MLQESGGVVLELYCDVEAGGVLLPLYRHLHTAAHASAAAAAAERSTGVGGEVWGLRCEV
jgi:hypothetical protein